MGSPGDLLPLPVPGRVRLANKVSHPRNVYLREDAFGAQVHDWIAGLFSSGRLEQTIDQIMASQEGPAPSVQADLARAKIAEAARKTARYKALIDAGADLDEVAAWITEAKHSGSPPRLSCARPPAPAA